MAKEPAIMEQLKDFTFYPDTTSVYGFTRYSLPQILTGKVFYNDVPYEEYFIDAWSETPYYKILEKNNYDIGLYTEGKYVYHKANIMNLERGQIIFNARAIKSFRNLVLFRASPHYLKRRFYQYNPNEWISMLQNQKEAVYREDDIRFYEFLKKGLTCNDDINCFRFYHLAGAHGPFILDRNIKSVPKEAGNQYEQAIGALRIVLEYIEQMKHKRLFDDSTFVIMADHGQHNTVGSRALLCVKYSGERNQKLKVSDTSISFSNFMPMVLRELNNNENNKSFSSKERYFYYSEGNAFVEYEIAGNANNMNSWTKKRVLTRPDNKMLGLYPLGTKIVFNWNSIIKNKEFGQFLWKGWDQIEEHAVWSVGSNSELQFKLKDYKNQDLQFQLCASAFLVNIPYRTVTVYANKKMITKLVMDNKKPVYTFKIPSSVISDDILNIRFSIDHSGIHKERDHRDLGIYLSWFIIEALP